MIHILQSVSNMDRGGIESMLMNYYRHLDRTRFQFDFLVNKKKPGFFDDEIRALGGRIFQSPGVAPAELPGLPAALCSSCWPCTRRSRCCHAHQRGHAAFCAGRR